MNNAECSNDIEADSNIYKLFEHRIIIASFGDITPHTEKYYTIGKQFGKKGSLYINQILDKSIDQNHLDLNYLSESIELDNGSKKHLQDIFLEFRAEPENKISKMALCYFPRNVIYFINQSNEVLAYIPICFECNRSELFQISSNYKITQRCLPIYKALKNFFYKNGIEYGITRTWILQN
ncbi:hypothetical protein [Aureibacter tunicatorum]|uniref:Uncharacterized protein n=1 Tax=Aureibacter tunicatorum TaxID=866807 RepID=A0AAE3XP65_9BACT|nr:hypothetical protein [Aureibacter tunicatorum]MDR6239490.1 hypothetical protein [Aureibacter tunicatorum]